MLGNASGGMRFAERRMDRSHGDEVARHVAGGPPRGALAREEPTQQAPSGSAPGVPLCKAQERHGEHAGRVRDGAHLDHPEAALFEHPPEPAGSAGGANVIGNEAGPACEREGERVAERDDGVRQVVEGEDQLPIAGEHAAQLAERRDLAAAAREVVERGVGDDAVEGAIAEGEVAHVAGEGGETGLASARGARGGPGDVHAHHHPGSPSELRHESLTHDLVEEIGLEHAPDAPAGEPSPEQCPVHGVAVRTPEGVAPASLPRAGHARPVSRASASHAASHLASHLASHTTSHAASHTTSHPASLPESHPSDGPLGVRVRHTPRWAWVAAAVLLAAHAVLAWHLRVPSITTGNDDAAYVLLARSLREGSYNSIYLAGAPLHVQYPPLWPALLAVLGTIVGERVDVFIALSVALSAAALLLVFDAARRLWSPRFALLALAAAAFLPVYVASAGRVMSEAPFAALGALTLWALAHRPLSRRMLALAIVAALAAALTRTVGATLLVALVLFLFVQHRRRAAVGLAAGLGALLLALVAFVHARSGLVVAAPYLADAVSGSGMSHGGALPAALAVAGRLVRNSVAYTGMLLPSSLAVPTLGGTRLDNITWLVVLVACWGAGLIVLWRRWRALALYLIVFGALLALWAWPIERFYVPLLPEIVLLTLAGAAALARRIGGRIGGRIGWSTGGRMGGRIGRNAVRIAPVMLAALMIGTSAGRLKIATRRVASCDRANPTISAGCYNRDQRDFFAAAALARRTFPDSAIVATSKAAAFYYYASRRAAAVPPSTRTPWSRQAAATALADARVAYVLLGRLNPPTDRALAALVLPVCDRLEVLRAFSPGTALLRVAPRALSTRGQNGCTFLAGYLALPRQTLPQKF